MTQWTPPALSGTMYCLIGRSLATSSSSANSVPSPAAPNSSWAVPTTASAAPAPILLRCLAAPGRKPCRLIWSSCRGKGILWWATTCGSGGNVPFCPACTSAMAPLWRPVPWYPGMWNPIPLWGATRPSCGKGGSIPSSPAFCCGCGGGIWNRSGCWNGCPCCVTQTWKNCGMLCKKS